MELLRAWDAVQGDKKNVFDNFCRMPFTAEVQAGPVTFYEIEVEGESTTVPVADAAAQGGVVVDVGER